MIDKILRNICFSILFILSITISAQNARYEYNADRSKVKVIAEISQAQLKSSSASNNEVGKPFVAAKLYPLVLDMGNAGQWTTLANGQKVWTLNVHTPDSHGALIRYQDFYIPEGAELHVYNKENVKDSWVFTHAHNPNGGYYSTEIYTGDNITLEYVASTTSNEVPRLNIYEVGYKHIELYESFDKSGNLLKNTRAGDEYSCMINVNCPEGDSWNAQRKGVVRIGIKIGYDWTYSSGTLINNTRNDKTPYILSAYHCFYAERTGNRGDMETAEFLFHYESPSCGNQDIPENFKMVGAEMLVANSINGGSDGVLVKLKNAINTDWGVYFNGWDRGNDGYDITSGAVIHHPKTTMKIGNRTIDAFIKKISFFDSFLTSGKWTDGANDAHWLVNYSSGVTAKGSSGSPLFNQVGLIVGTLTGGESSCDRPEASDYYGKMWYHWDQGNNALGGNMKQYLDPDNIGIKRLAGSYINDGREDPLTVERSEIKTVVNVSINVSILNGNGDYEVSSTNDAIASAQIADEGDGKTINIRTNKLGTAVLTVKDGRGQTKLITVRVIENLNVSLDENKILTMFLLEPDDTIKQVRLLNLTGHTLFEKKGIEDLRFSMDVSGYVPAVYIVQVITHKGHTLAKKIAW